MTSYSSINILMLRLNVLVLDCKFLACFCLDEMVNLSLVF